VNGDLRSDLHEVLKRAQQASKAARRLAALVEVQDRVGRLLREIGLKRSSPEIDRPPSPIKGDLD
jgi:hypothetical protein